MNRTMRVYLFAASLLVSWVFLWNANHRPEVLEEALRFYIPPGAMAAYGNPEIPEPEDAEFLNIPFEAFRELAETNPERHALVSYSYRRNRLLLYTYLLPLGNGKYYRATRYRYTEMEGPYQAHATNVDHGTWKIEYRYSLATHLAYWSAGILGLAGMVYAMSPLWLPPLLRRRAPRRYV